jgi:hypothetical protein
LSLQSLFCWLQSFNSHGWFLQELPGSLSLHIAFGSLRASRSCPPGAVVASQHEGRYGLKIRVSYGGVTQQDWHVSWPGVGDEGGAGQMIGRRL